MLQIARDGSALIVPRHRNKTLAWTSAMRMEIRRTALFHSSLAWGLNFKDTT